VHNISDVRQIKVHTAEPLVPFPSHLEAQIAIVKLKKYKSPGSDAIHILINSIFNKEELPDQWKESIIAQIHKKGDKTDCNNYRGISLLSTSYKILLNILLSRLNLYIDEITGDHQCGFRCNRSTTEQIFCLCQILEKKFEFIETVH
jgi:hypothetical protein